MSYFCSPECYSASKTNVPITRSCVFCGKEFTRKGNKDYRKTVHCSRECASANSVTDTRRAVAKANGIKATASWKVNFSVHKALRSREWHKYTNIDEYLNACNIKHVFEHDLNGYSYDLCLWDKKILVEFDGEYHKDRKQAIIDKAKDTLATEQGYTIHRVLTSIIPYPIQSIEHILMAVME